MKIAHIALVSALVLTMVPFPARAQNDDEQAQNLYAAIQAQAQHDQKEGAQKGEKLNLEFNKRIQDISKNSGPKEKAAFKKAVLAFMAYQKAMGEAVEISYSEEGGHGGDAAATHSNIMTGEDFLKLLDQFYSK